MSNDEKTCPNTLPGASCIDPDCAYCRIAQAEQPHTIFVAKMLAGPVLPDPLANRTLVGVLKE
jgi:hypothetical protein